MVRVNQADWESPAYADWAATLEAAVAASAEPPLLVGHSTACALVARWSQASRLAVRGALLVGPSDTEGPNYPLGPTGFSPMPLGRIPFPTIVVASDDDPYVSLERARFFAASWGSELVVVPGAGHLNSDSGLGDWPDGLALLDRLSR